MGLGVPLELLAVRIAADGPLPAAGRASASASTRRRRRSSRTGFSACLGRDDRVTVELTEHLHVDDYEGFTARLGPLREAGGEVAIDDFGAGYASLRHILRSARSRSSSTSP